MSDEQNVDAGSETSGEQTEASQETASAETAETTEQPAESAQDAGGAAEPTEEERAAAAERGENVQGGTPNADESRTGFVSNARQGDACICPDGRTGTVHKFDEGLVCIPNADQG